VDLLTNAPLERIALMTGSPAATRAASTGPDVQRLRAATRSRCARCSPQRNCAMRRSRSTTRSMAQADSEQPGCLRHRDRSEGAEDRWPVVFFSVTMSPTVQGRRLCARRGRLRPKAQNDQGPALDHSGSSCGGVAFRSGSSGEPEARRGGEQGDTHHRRAHRRAIAAVRLGSRVEEAQFHTPVFVVTHEKRDPRGAAGWTTFHFVNDAPVARSGRQARDGDVRTAAAAQRSWRRTPA
jgi:hypothetical protein